MSDSLLSLCRSKDIRSIRVPYKYIRSIVAGGGVDRSCCRSTSYISIGVATSFPLRSRLVVGIGSRENLNPIWGGGIGRKYGGYM